MQLPGHPYALCHRDLRIQRAAGGEDQSWGLVSTSADLESDPNNSDRVRDEVSGAGTVTITIGANDLETDLQHENAGACAQSCYAPDISAVRGRMSHILQQIWMLRAGESTIILVTNYWNVLADGDVAKAAGSQRQLAWSDAVTRPGQ